MGFIDFRSDTVTLATPAMREAMFHAEIGDDVYGDDPTMNRLEALAAQMLGKEAALFVPSGTMGNQVAVMTHTRRGDEILVGENNHVVTHEVAAAAMLSGCQLRTLSFENDIPDPEKIRAAIRPEDIHNPQAGLICMENALSNGRVVPLQVMQQVYQLAKEHQLPVHLDGARIFNAACALGVDVKELTACCDSVMACLSKGLCAPVGSVLCGSEEFIRRARRTRKAFGGGMRQAGFLAAAGILALTEMTRRLPEDHENARYLADRLCAIEGVVLDAPVEINMVFVHFEHPVQKVRALPEKMLEKGIKMQLMGENTARFVTHHDISRENIDYFAACLAQALA